MTEDIHEHLMDLHASSLGLSNRKDGADVVLSQLATDTILD